MAHDKRGWQVTDVNKNYVFTFVARTLLIG